MSLIKDGTPGSINLGADDKSKRVVYASTEDIPQHLPLCFHFGKKGTTKRILASADKALLAYGSDTFDLNGKYFNHQTLYMLGFLGQGNVISSKRMIPTDAGPKANSTVYLDYIKTEVPNYIRSSSGDLVADGTTGDYKVDPIKPTIPGYSIKFIREYDTYQYDADGKVILDPDSVALGLKTPKEGTMVDANGVKSRMVPFMEARAAEKGKAYSDIGFGFNSTFKNDIDKSVVSKTKSMPYQFFLVSRENESTSPVNVRTLTNETYQTVSLKPKTLNPTTSARMDLEPIFKDSWFNEKDPSKRLAYNEYEGMYLYREYLEPILKEMAVLEAGYVSFEPKTWDDGVEAASSTWYDFTTNDKEAIKDELYLINLFACKTSRNIPYHTIVKNTENAATTGNQIEVMFSGSTPVYLAGGTDGTLTNEMFETCIKAELQKYLDRDTEVHDTAVNVDSILYDSGYSLDIKRELINYIMLRKDTHVVLGTHIATMGAKTLALADSRAIGVALKTKLALAPESTYFGTSVARCIICLGAGVVKGSAYTDLAPLTYEVAMKCARMMGAGNGLWKVEEVFDSAPKSKLEFMIDVQPSDIPESFKPTLWADGFVWVQPYDRETAHFPSFQTVYSDDTSVLNNFFATLALCVLSKTADKAWREHTGSTTLTEGQFKEKIVTFVTNKLRGIFAGMFTVIPEVFIDEGDKQRGYSWHLVCKLYGNTMKTKQVYNSEVYRASDLTTSASN